MITDKLNGVIVGRGGTTAHHIDKDNDGHGVMSINGPDADENDPIVNTTESVIEMYGTLSNYLSVVKGYTPMHFYFMDVNGNDDTGSIDNEAKPFKTWEAIHGKLNPGDAVIYRNGTYNESINGRYPSVSGTKEAPIVIMSYPGESVIIDRIGSGISIGNCNYLIFDGLTCRNTETGLGRAISMGECTNIVFRNMDAGYATSALFAMQGLHNILIEDSVFHDTQYNYNGTHCVYLGAREMPNSNITMRRNLIYNGGLHAFQHNGRVTNLIFEDNICHSCNMAGISLLMGVSDSIFRNNLVFNNNQGLVLYNYISGASTILPHDQTNNLFINNIFWTGKYRYSTGKEEPGPKLFPSVHFNNYMRDDKGVYHPELLKSFDNNVFRNNVFVSHTGPVFRFDQEDYLDSTTFENNIVYRYGGQDRTLIYGRTFYDFNEFENFSDLINDNKYTWPEFNDVSLDYATTPEKFNFDCMSLSPCIDSGIFTDAPISDLKGRMRTNAPDIGCYEYLPNLGGDLNGDNLVDINDYIGMLDTLGTIDSDIDYNSKADYDTDGRIRYSDFKTWYNHYNGAI